ncbi:MAG: hypothetical protein V7746_04600 [Halioglobus sp.]
MKKCNLILLAALATVPVQAYDWPWQSEKEVEHDFCKGFVMAALGADELTDTSRVGMWLTWNYVNRVAVPEGSSPETDLQAGRDRLDAMVADNDIQGIRDFADSDCYLGRNRHYAEMAGT